MAVIGRHLIVEPHVTNMNSNLGNPNLGKMVRAQTRKCNTDHKEFVINISGIHVPDVGVKEQCHHPQ